MPESKTAPSPDLASRIRETPWYHTLELPDGIVTEGWFDLRPYVDRYALPDDMSGMRALEVGTWDGFWAFEMERRGADVVALDLDDERELDWPPRRRPTEHSDVKRGVGFALAREALGSKVERVVRNVYDATPEELGTFDLVFCGSVLIHVRDQLLALERIANLCTGTFISAEEYDRRSALIPGRFARYTADRDAAVVFWLPSPRTWRRMMWSAGFDEVESKGKFKMRSEQGFTVRHVIHHCRKG